MTGPRRASRLRVASASRSRRWVESVALFVGLPSSIITIALGFGTEGWWSAIWSRWTVAWCCAVVVLVAALGLVAAAWVHEPDNQRWPNAIRRLGVIPVVAAWLATFQLPRVTGSLLLASTCSTVLLVAWLASWVTASKRALHETAWRTFRHGIERWGHKLDPLHQFLIHVLKGPRPKEPQAELTMRRAGTAGVLLVGLAWLVFTVAGAFTIDRTLETLSPRDRKDPEASETAQVRPETAPPRPGDATPASPPTPPPEAQGSQHCNFRAGEGPDVPASVTAVVAKTVTKAEESFLICPTEQMTWRQSTEVYEQAVFTYDGEGAALVAWRARREWMATFVSSDDAAAYRLVSPSLDWNRLGKPLPFMRCDGLWVQPFVGREGRLVGVGVRSSEDVERRADQPLYVWGMTVEVLLNDVPHALELPYGGPARDVVGPVQYFAGGHIVRAPQEAAAAMTAEELLAHCA